MTGRWPMTNLRVDLERNENHEKKKISRAKIWISFLGPIYHQSQVETQLEWSYKCWHRAVCTQALGSWISTVRHLVWISSVSPASFYRWELIFEEFGTTTKPFIGLITLAPHSHQETVRKPFRYLSWRASVVLGGLSWHRWSIPTATWTKPGEIRTDFKVTS